MASYSTRSKSMAISEEVKQFFQDLVEPLVTYERLDEMLTKLNDKIVGNFEKIVNEQNEKIEALESKVAVQNNIIEKLKIEADNNQQYQRRSNLRVHGIPINEGGDEDVLTGAKKCYEKVDLAFNPDEIDRAHRIGKAYRDKASKKLVKSIIIKFKSWNARESFYKARPRGYINGVKKPGQSFSVSVDLTKRKYDLLKKAKGVINGNKDINYALADINCSLAFKMKDESLQFFNSESDLNRLINVRS